MLLSLGMLDIKKENLAGSKVKLTINLPPEIMRGYFTRIYNKLAPQAEVKGFRPGKAPRNLTISAIGESRLVSEIIDLAISETYGQALKQENLIPIAPPKINIKKMVDITGDTAEIEYEAEVDLMPDVKVGDYKKLKVKTQKIKHEAKKDEIDQVLSHLQRQHATFKEIERPAKEGDRVEIDFEGTERGVKLENLSSKNYPVILGSKVLIPDFESNIIGMKKGDSKEFDLNMGEKSAKGGSASGGKKIHFKVRMNDVKEVILPPLDDELAKKFQKKNLAELKTAVEADIIKQKEIAEKQSQENQVVEELLKIIDVQIPQSLIDQEINRMLENLKNRISMSGMPFEKYLEQIRKTEDEIKKDFRPQAEKTIKVGLALGEIGKLEKIDLKQKDAGKLVMEKLVSYTK